MFHGSVKVGILNALLVPLVAVACDAAKPEVAAKPSLPASADAAPVDTAPTAVAPTAPTTAAPAVAALTVAKPRQYSHAKVPADAPTFVVAGARAEGNNASELRLFELDGPQAFAASGSVVMHLHADGSIEYAPQWARGIDDSDIDLDAVTAGFSWWQTELLGGGWPDGAILVLRPQSGGRGGDETPATYRRANGIWSQIASSERLFDRYPRAVGRWTGGSLLALYAFEPRYAHPGDEEQDTPASEIAASAAAIAKQKRLVVLRGTPKAPAFGARDVQAFASQPSGEILAAITKGDRTVVLHHDASGDRELSLPGRGVAPSEEIRLEMSAPDRAWLVGRGVPVGDASSTGYVAHFDGTAWIETPTECDAAPLSLSVDREGSAYFVCGVPSGKDDSVPVLFRVRAGVLEELPLAGRPTAVVAIAPNDLWVAVGGWDLPTQLLHTGAPKREPFTIPDASAGPTATLEWAEPHPLTKTCERIWIPLAPGANKADVEAKIESLKLEDLSPEVRDVHLRGKVAWGVVIRYIDKRGAQRVGKLVAALGDLVGTPSCNAYPLVDPD